MMSQFIMDIKSEPIHNHLKSSKNRFDYSFQAPPQLDQVLDLSKRRDSTETRKSLSPSSLEGGSPSTRHSPPNNTSVNILHRHNHITKQVFTPEHSLRYQYNYDHSPPSSTSPINKNDNLRSPHQRYERYDRSPIQRTQRSPSPQPTCPMSASEYFLKTQKNEPIQEHNHHDLSNGSPPRRSHNSSSCSSTSSQISPSSSSNPSMLVMGRDGKLSRPFKAYPRDPMSLSTGTMMDAHSAEKYTQFRKRMLDQIHAANGGQQVINNPKMRRMSSKNCTIETNNNDLIESSYDTEKIMIHNSITGKDEAYFERRKKNNAAAKKSRDRRRIKEDEIAIRAAFLERENIELKFELASSRKQLAIYANGIPN